MRSWSHVALLACLTIEWLTSCAVALSIDMSESFLPNVDGTLLDTAGHDYRKKRSVETDKNSDNQASELTHRSKRFAALTDQSLSDYPSVRLRRQFYRFGRSNYQPYQESDFSRFSRAYQPYQDKRFLRFGRSGQSNLDDALFQPFQSRDLLNEYDSVYPTYRKKRSAETETELANQSEGKSHRSKRSAELTDQSLSDDPSVRLRRQFYRFGRSNYQPYQESDFSRFSRAYQPYQDKRFLRFGRSGQSNLDDALFQPFQSRDLLNEYDSVFPTYRKKRSVETETDLDDQSDEESHRSKRSADLIDQSLSDDPYVRLRRQFYRFGRNFQPYQDKRFLRFGRSGQSNLDDVLFQPFQSRDLLNEYDSVFPTYRKKRSAETETDLDDQSDEESHLTKRSSNRMKRQFYRFGRSNYQPSGKSEASKRFMRFGKRFMRFGREPGEEKRFMRFGKKSVLDLDNDDDVFYNEFDKRFMRFGKRFMRFGKREDEDEKRFMRFGKREGEGEKRFMRFGKSGGGNNKRFMRFGKSLNHDDEKRFMRFGKRFMRFGKRDTGSAEEKQDSNSEQSGQKS